jgi:hypothetical protein
MRTLYPSKNRMIKTLTSIMARILNGINLGCNNTSASSRKKKHNARTVFAAHLQQRTYNCTHSADTNHSSYCSCSCDLWRVFITITVTDSLGFTGSQAFTITVSAPLAGGGSYTFG